MTLGPASASDPALDATTGVILVDHGSRRAESNDMLLRVVELFRRHSRYRIIEPAHMELAEPSIGTAFDRCVARGARRIVVMPYFLLPGRHWDQDIPRLSAQAAARHPGATYLVTAPIGLHPLMSQLIESRLTDCLACAAGAAPECEVCAGTGRCRKWQRGDHVAI
jgi:sirohydrochlorin ferrochelatase